VEERWEAEWKERRIGHEEDRFRRGREISDAAKGCSAVMQSMEASFDCRCCRCVPFVCSYARVCAYLVRDEIIQRRRTNVVALRT